MRILFVAMPHSVHTARWINQIVDQHHEIHLFPSMATAPHPLLKNVKLHCTGIGLRYLSRFAGIIQKKYESKHIPFPKPFAALFDRSFWLTQVIKKVKPDIIDSLEIQHAGYLTLAARKRIGNKFPAWIVTNWGSDIYLFGRLTEHVYRVKAVLAACDYYSCECHRDVQLAKDMGLQGEVLPVLPNTGGFDLTHALQFRQPGPTSSRKLILLKGYQGWVGRALVGLRAIEMCANELRDYRVAIYLASNDVAIAAELTSQSTGIPIDLIPPCSHDEMLRLFGRARVYIGLSISDAISTSLLEAITMGAFPIQSCTSCANEWIEESKTGLIVSPDDPEVVAAAIKRSVSDDALVDRAAEANARLAKERLDQSVIKPQVISMYEKVARQACSKLKGGQT
jgi:glycosyltransferase involved in cell wall biosynthesis